QLLVEASATLLGSVHLDNPCQSILATVGRLTGADGCAIWEADIQRGVWRIVASRGLSELFSAVTVVAPEGHSPSEIRQQQYDAEGIRDVLALPLDFSERQGQLALYYRVPCKLSAMDTRLASGMANAAAAALRSWQLLREREQSRVMMELTV